jgi:hypothetical protein
MPRTNLLRKRRKAPLLLAGKYPDTKDTTGTKVKTPETNPLSPFVYFVFERKPV